MLKWLAALLVLAVGFVHAEPSSPLVVVVQVGHLNKEVVKQFEQQSGVNVALIEFADQQQRDVMLTTTADQMDVVELDGSGVFNYNALNLIQPIMETEVPVLTQFAEDPMSQIGVPYVEGALGVAWRDDLVVNPVSSWNRLFAQDSELAGSILMPDDPLKAVAVAHFYLGQPLQSISASTLQAAHDVLKSQAPFVFYHSVGLEASDMLVTGEASVAVTTSTDAELLKRKFNVPLTFSLPAEGCMRWRTYWNLVRTSKAKAAAIQFINFMTQPAQTALNSAATGLTLAYSKTENATAYRACQPTPLLAPNLVKDINFLFFNLRRIQ